MRLLEKLLIGLAIIMIVTGIVLPFWFRLGVYSDHLLNQIGQVGDFITGTTTPFLTFSSILLLLVTIRIQNRQIDMQTQELENQRFEERFFRALSIVESHRKEVEYHNVHGADAFKIMLNETRQIFGQSKSQEERIKEARNCFTSNSRRLEIYYKLIVTSLKHLEASKVKDKGYYINFLYDLLSVDEILVLFYLSLCTKDSNPGFGLLSKYDFWKYMHSLSDEAKTWIKEAAATTNQ